MLVGGDPATNEPVEGSRQFKCHFCRRRYVWVSPNGIKAMEELGLVPGCIPCSTKADGKHQLVPGDREMLCKRFGVTDDQLDQLVQQMTAEFKRRYG